MPNEGRKFKAVDGSWRRLMERLTKQAEVGGCVLLLLVGHASGVSGAGSACVQRGFGSYQSGSHATANQPTNQPTTWQQQVLVVTGDEELLKSLTEANRLLEQVCLCYM
jgi:hypothetical protein